MPTLSQFLEGYPHGGRVGDIREMTQASKAEDLVIDLVLPQPSCVTTGKCHNPSEPEFLGQLKGGKKLP